MVNSILIVGFGDIGVRCAALLRPRHRVFALVRTAQKAALARRLGVTPILADLDNKKTLVKLAAARGAKTILHFAPPPTQGTHDKRTRHLLAALSMSGALPQQIIYISTSGVYGDCLGEWVDETRRVNPESPRAVRRVDAEKCLRSWGKHHQVAVSILRAPGIYAQDRLPIVRINAATPAINAEEDSYTNHIHADDLAQAVLMAMRNGKRNGKRSGKRNRVYNIVDNSNMKMGDYFDLVANAFGLNSPPRISRSQAEQTMNPNLLSFMRESRRLKNNRMKNELGIKLRYPTVKDFLDAFVITRAENRHQ